MDHLPRRDVIQNHRDRLDIPDLVGDRHEMLGSTNQAFGKAAVDSQGRDPLPDSEARHISANRLDDACDFVTADEGYLRREHVVSRQHRQIGRANT